MIHRNVDSLRDSSGTWLERHNEGRCPLPDTTAVSRDDVNGISAMTKTRLLG